MPKNNVPLPNDGIYRSILWVLVLTVVAGAALAIIGETLLHDQAVVELGAWIAVVGGAIYVFFRWLGARAARRQGPPDPSL